MSHTVIFNLVPLRDGFWRPEAWIASENAHGLPYNLVQRVSKVRLGDWPIEQKAELLKCMQCAELLLPEALLAKFTTGKSKTITLDKLWDDKLIKPSIEKYVSRLMGEFFETASGSLQFLSLEAQGKPLLNQCTLSYAPELAKATLFLERHDDGLNYRLKVLVNDRESIDFQQIKVLGFGVPAWFVYKGSLQQLPFVSGKMLLPFMTKPQIDIAKKMERQWIHKILKKNIERDTDIEVEGFDLSVTDTFDHAHLQLSKHVFSGDYCCLIRYEYQNRKVAMGEQQKVFCNIVIPEDENLDLQIVKTIRDLTAEQACEAYLESLGLRKEGGMFVFASTFSANEAVLFLREHEAAFAANRIVVNYHLPETGAEIVRYEAVFKTSSKAHRDWFDLQIVVCIGSFELPFKAFYRHIQQGKSDFVLPDGKVFLLPDAWFTTYKDVANLYGAQSEENEGDVLSISALDEENLSLFGIQPPKKQQKIPSAFDAASLAAGVQLRPYQQNGVVWMLQNFDAARGCCLADDMGLGKTLQTIAVLSHLQKHVLTKKDQPQQSNSSSVQFDLFAPPVLVEKEIRANLQALVIVPASLVHNWMQELMRFAPHLKVLVHTGPKRSHTSSIFSMYDVVISTYHTVREDIELLQKTHFSCLVLDESQQIKNRDSEISKAVRKLNSDFRLALSGTPIENALSELWTLVHFLNPTMLGTFTSFKRMYQEPIEKEKDLEAKAQLRKKVDTIFLRRTKEAVAPELPPLMNQTVLVPMHEAQRELYEQLKSAVRNEILAIQDEKAVRFTALQAITKLRQLACCPPLVQADYNGQGGKMEVVLEQWAQITAQGSKVLIFSTFEQHIRQYMAHFDATGARYVHISGSVSAENRNLAVQQFQHNPEVQTFFLTLKAGGVGLNLTAADYVFILDPWWNPKAEDQAIARAHRIGQQKPVHAFRFISEESIEEKILQLQIDKTEMSEGIIGNDLESELEAFDLAHLRRILTE